MPAAQFSHPTASIVFSRAPLRPAYNVKVIQATARSAGGVVFGYDPVATEVLLPLAWRGLPGPEVHALELFVSQTVNGMAGTFVYVDTDGTEHAVRMARPKLQISERAYGRYDVGLTLMEV